MVLIGHQKALEALPSPVPPSVLVMGPEGVGKSLVAAQVASWTGAESTDLLDVGELTVPAARSLIKHVNTRPRFGTSKTVIAELTSRSNGPNVLLKTLEEPPPGVHVVLHSSLPVPLTILSRCFRVQCGTLTTDEVAQVLVKELGWDSNAAVEAAQLSGGRVSVARTSGLKQARYQMAAVAKAVAANDPALLDSVVEGSLKTIKDADAIRRAAVQMLTEARANRAQVYDPTVLSMVRKAGDENIDIALISLAGRSRSSLAIRAALCGLL